MVAWRYEIYLQVGYRFERDKINFISPSNHVIFCLLYKPTMVSGHFLEIFKLLYESRTNFSKDCQRLRRNIQRCFNLKWINFGNLELVGKVLQ